MKILSRLNLALAPSRRELEERLADRGRHETFARAVGRIHRRT